MTRAGAVTGLNAEARLIERAHARAKRPGPPVLCLGPGGARAEAAAKDLLARGATALVSFGLCAGLNPDLRAGDLMLAETVATDSDRYETDPAWRGRLAASFAGMGLRVSGGILSGRDRAVAKAEDKRELFHRTGAWAADMESHGVGRAARAAGVPFIVARAVADTSGRSLPRAALKAVGPDGRLKVLTALTAMYLTPWEGPAMIRVAFETRLAFDTLERIAGPDGGLFGGG